MKPMYLNNNFIAATCDNCNKQCVNKWLNIHQKHIQVKRNCHGKNQEESLYLIALEHKYSNSAVSKTGIKNAFTILLFIKVLVQFLDRPLA